MRTLRFAAGIFLVITGLIITPLPIPIGLLMVLAGLAILVPESLWLRRIVRDFRSRNPKFEQKLQGIRPKAPRFIQRVIAMTTPPPWRKPIERPEEK